MMNSRRILAVGLALVSAACNEAPAPATHEGTCCGCHVTEPGAGCAAPTDGLPDPTPAIHAAHLRSSDWHRRLECDQCHQVPQVPDAAGHADTQLPAEITWGPIAQAGGYPAAHEPASRSCRTWCHDSAASEGRPPPTWYDGSGAPMQCGSCHEMPPAGPHPARSDCGACHDRVIDEAGRFVRPELHVDGTVQVRSGDCSLCHGTPGYPAPPMDTSGESATTRRGVGAHRRHLGVSSWHAAIACSQCHEVPEDPEAPGHKDTALPAEVAWGPLARAGGARPRFDFDSGTCADVYCHGAALPDGGGRLTAPVWTRVDGTQAACGTCHALPPSGTHATRDDCAACHGMVVDTENRFVAPELHINGRVDVDTLGCDACHGGPENAAPPRSTTGATETTDPGVGAHQVHVREAGWRARITCAGCHLVPYATSASGHLDGTPPAEVRLTGVALTGGFSGTYDPQAGTCDVYCHGATLRGGRQNAQPVWTEVNGLLRRCDGCHGFPPGGGHVSRLDCLTCHPARLSGGGRHIDGHLDVSPLACDGCHGSDGVAAPPRDLDGNTETTDPGVGAHRRHLQTSDQHAPIACSECHLVPRDLEAAGHTDTAPPAELVWGRLATHDGATPAYEPETGRCVDTYCHGATLDAADGTATDPVWTRVDGSQGTCTGCHGMPPAGSHSQREDCSLCHPEVIAPDGSFVDPKLHVDGTVQARRACDGCHGADGVSAPPRALSGATATTDPGVGAHRSHLKSTAAHAAVPCAECHVVPAALEAAGHMDADPGAELTWGALATRAGATPSYDPASRTCRNTYCHGAAFVDGAGTATAPSWVVVDGSQATCGSCHGMPPGGAHPPRADCASCHGEVVNADASFSAPERHVDGVIDVVRDRCYGCHGSMLSPAPPAALSGATATLDPGVGAHQQHLKPSGWHPPIACTACHVVPTGIGDAGHMDTPAPAEVTFSGVAARHPASYDRSTGRCTVYCHQPFSWAPGSAVRPRWTQVDGSQAACGSCHAVPPPSHGNATDCWICHDAVMAPDGSFRQPSQHMDGFVDWTHAPPGTSCDWCH